VQRAAALGHDPLILGRYRPLRPLGSGGSGSVWLVRDEERGGDVALKIVSREGRGGPRAEREVDAVARLRHPSCVRALELEVDDEHVYVTYEYIPGKTLRQTIRDGELDDATAVEAAAQLLDALAYAHRKGVVHRDVKPSNVMLEEGDGVKVRLLDFGLAVLEEAETITAAGDIPGTLAYISPERLDGDEATGAADVWAVGVILWEALVGWHPFAAGTPSPVEVAKRISRGAPPLAKLRPDLPRPLASAVDRMLVVDPARRPPARRLAPELRAAAQTQPKPRPVTSLPVLLERAPHAACAGIVTAAVTLLLPFFPAGWPFLLGGLAAITSLLVPRLGLALALAAPVLPLGNVSVGLSLAYGAVAAAWFVLFVGDPRRGLFWLSGPLLAPLGLLPVATIAAAQAHGAVRRFAIGVGSSLAAMAAAGLAGRPLPFTGDDAPSELGIGAGSTMREALAALATFLAENPVLAVDALLIGLAAATVPEAMRRGLWGASLWGSGLVAGLVLAPLVVTGAGIDPFPLVLGVWLAAIGVAVLAARARR
jgi:hypothetical protein